MRKLTTEDHRGCEGNGKERFVKFTEKLDQRWRAGCDESRKSGSAGGMGKRTVRQRALYLPDVLRLIGCFVLFYTSRVICKERLTMEEIIFSLKHYWRFVDSEAFELKALSEKIGEKAA